MHIAIHMVKLKIKREQSTRKWFKYELTNCFRFVYKKANQILKYTLHNCNASAISMNEKSNRKRLKYLLMDLFRTILLVFDIEIDF